MKTELHELLKQAERSLLDAWHHLDDATDMARSEPIELHQAISAARVDVHHVRRQVEQLKNTRETNEA